MAFLTVESNEVYKYTYKLIDRERDFVFILAVLWRTVWFAPYPKELLRPYILKESFHLQGNEMDSLGVSS